MSFVFYVKSLNFSKNYKIKYNKGVPMMFKVSYFDFIIFDNYLDDQKHKKYTFINLSYHVILSEIFSTLKSKKHR